MEGFWVPTTEGVNFSKIDKILEDLNEPPLQVQIALEATAELVNVTEVRPEKNSEDSIRVNQLTSHSFRNLTNKQAGFLKQYVVPNDPEEIVFDKLKKLTPTFKQIHKQNQQNEVTKEAMDSLATDLVVRGIMSERDLEKMGSELGDPSFVDRVLVASIAQAGVALADELDLLEECAHSPTVDGTTLERIISYVITKLNAESARLVFDALETNDSSILASAAMSRNQVVFNDLENLKLSNTRNAICLKTMVSDEECILVIRNKGQCETSQWDSEEVEHAWMIAKMITFLPTIAESNSKQYLTSETQTEINREILKDAESQLQASFDEQNYSTMDTLPILVPKLQQTIETMFPASLCTVLLLNATYEDSFEMIGSKSRLHCEDRCEFERLLRKGAVETAVKKRKKQEIIETNSICNTIAIEDSRKDWIHVDVPGENEDITTVGSRYHWKITQDEDMLESIRSKCSMNSKNNSLQILYVPLFNSVHESELKVPDEIHDIIGGSFLDHQFSTQASKTAGTLLGLVILERENGAFSQDDLPLATYLAPRISSILNRRIEYSCTNRELESRRLEIERAKQVNERCLLLETRILDGTRALAAATTVGELLRILVTEIRHLFLEGHIKDLSTPAACLNADRVIEGWPASTFDAKYSVVLFVGDTRQLCFPPRAMPLRQFKIQNKSRDRDTSWNENIDEKKTMFTSPTSREHCVEEIPYRATEFKSEFELHDREMECSHLKPSRLAEIALESDTAMAGILDPSRNELSVIELDPIEKVSRVEILSESNHLSEDFAMMEFAIPLAIQQTNTVLLIQIERQDVVLKSKRPHFFLERQLSNRSEVDWLTSLCSYFSMYLDSLLKTEELKKALYTVFTAREKSLQILNITLRDKMKNYLHAMALHDRAWLLGSDEHFVSSFV